jgi:hypothetical protein
MMSTPHEVIEKLILLIPGFAKKLGILVTMGGRPRLWRSTPDIRRIATAGRLYARKLLVEGRHPDIDGLYIVLAGNLNPAIFQPIWLAQHGIVTQEEAENATIEIIRPEIATYDLNPFRFTVQPERFQIETLRPDQSFRMSEIVGQIFRILSETPVRQMALHRTMHFKLGSTEEWHNIGHRLVPKDSWRGIMEDPGMLSVIVKGTRVSRDSKFFQVQCEPSRKVEHGLYVQTTEHFDNPTASALWVEEVLTKSWGEAQSYALTAAQKLIENVLAP